MRKDVKQYDKSETKHAIYGNKQKLVHFSSEKSTNPV